MAYKLIRDAALEAFSELAAAQDNDALQHLYASEKLQRVLDQATLFKVWHGFVPLSTLSDEALRVICEELYLDRSKLFEYTDYFWLIDEYLETIQNKNTQYTAKRWIYKIADIAVHTKHRDLQEMTLDDTNELGNNLLAIMTPSSIVTAFSAISSFCRWCIANQKYPGAMNSFSAAPRLDLQAFARKNLPSSEFNLRDRLDKALLYGRGDYAPIVCILSWMGFTLQEMLDIRNEDVSVTRCTVCERQIPRALYDILRDYALESGEFTWGVSPSLWHLENLGYLLKKAVRADTGTRLDVVRLRQACGRAGMTPTNIYLAGQFDRLLTKEMREGPISEAEFREMFAIKSDKNYAYKMELYNAYKSLIKDEPD